MTMKVSILVPTFNRGYVVRDALESALAQTYRDFEIVVVDDGSMDNTAEVVAGCHTESIRYIKHEKNRGYSAACNTALLSAKGDILGFLDSDDVWKPNYLETLVPIFLSHLDVSAAFSNTEIVQKDGASSLLMSNMKKFPHLLTSKGERDVYIFKNREMYLCLLEEVPVKPSAVLFRREIFKNVEGFNESWPSGTDWDLFLRIARSYSFGYVDRPLVTQRVSADSTYKNAETRDKEFLISVFSKEKLTVRDDAEASAAIHRTITTLYENLAFLQLSSGNRGKATMNYLRAFRESFQLKMLLKAGATVLPLSWRTSLRNISRRVDASNS
jgi:glycosyltransferase involved in cell wall biosynthesis